MKSLVTAARIGQSGILVDWSAASSLTPSKNSHQHFDEQTIEKTLQKFKLLCKPGGEVGFYEAPLDPTIHALEQTTQLVKKLHSEREWKDCFILGIGGSALGPLTVLSSLLERRKNKIRFHFLENADSDEWYETSQSASPETTLVVAITKSGTTFETMAQLQLALSWLGQARVSSHLVVITDPKKGDLRQWADHNKVQNLPIAPSVGGRFSVFTPVGLFPILFAGLDGAEFLKGAALVKEHFEKTPVGKSPIWALASEIFRFTPSVTTHVCMPYTSRLKLFGSWFVQLWGESLGKDQKGYTPVAALGATDQHSLLQLLRDGPNDKMTFFVTVDQASKPCPVPAHPIGIGKTDQAAFRTISGVDLHQLLLIEYRATSRVLTQNQRANITFQLDRIEEKSIGALLYTWCVLTSVVGIAMGVNPYDQPGVEEGKVYIREMLNEARSSGSGLSSMGGAHTKDDEGVHRLRLHLKD